MENNEFLYHLYILRDMLKNPLVRIILMHPPYTQNQQKIIDSICRQSTQIIGQVLRKPPITKAAQEIQRLLMAQAEPLIPRNKLKYVIMGQQKNVPENFQ